MLDTLDPQLICANNHVMLPDARFCGECGSEAAPIKVTPSCLNGHELDDEQKFCGVCGAASVIPATVSAKPTFCENCGRNLASDAMFCTTCGAQGGRVAAAATLGAVRGYPQSAMYTAPNEMGFGAAIRSSMRKYAKFQGRASKAEFWYFYMFVALIGLIFLLLPSPDPIPAWLLILNIIITLIVIVLALPELAVSVRRMHDVGKSGWYCLIPFYFLVLAGKPSQPGVNKYGEMP